MNSEPRGVQEFQHGRIMDDNTLHSKDLFQKTKSEHLLLAQTIERLLAKRREEMGRGMGRLVQLQKTWSREWTRAELTDVAYSSYRALLNGKLKNFPARDQVLAIGDYLACTPLEVNSLLLAAGYTPLREHLNYEQEEAVLELTQRMLGPLPMPTIVVACDWNILWVNPATVELFGMDSLILRSIARQPMNLLEAIFDDTFPLLEYFHPDSREALARQSLYHFRMNNLLYQHERWYSKLLDRLWHLPRFAALWRATEEQAKLQSLEPPNPIRIRRSGNKTEEVLMVPVRIGNGITPSPHVLTFVPMA